MRLCLRSPQASRQHSKRRCNLSWLLLEVICLLRGKRSSSCANMCLILRELEESSLSTDWMPATRTRLFKILVLSPTTSINITPLAHQKQVPLTLTNLHPLLILLAHSTPLAPFPINQTAPSISTQYHHLHIHLLEFLALHLTQPHFSTLNPHHSINLPHLHLLFPLHLSFSPGNLVLMMPKRGRHQQVVSSPDLSLYLMHPFLKK